ncbi:hypothetical protein ACC738_37430, partial [Rhizobium ruizarguesonis]
MSASVFWLRRKPARVGDHRVGSRILGLFRLEAAYRQMYLQTEPHKSPKRQDIKSILIIGAGPIVIGQACE